MIRGNPDLDNVEEMCALLVEKDTSLKELDLEIEPGIHKDELEEELETVQRYTEDICVRKTKLRLLNARDNESEGSTLSNKTTQLHAIKLPRLVIEQFYRDASLWQTFWNQFDMAIHRNTGLGKADKFNYLKSYLSGKARCNSRPIR